MPPSGGGRLRGRLDAALLDLAERLLAARRPPEVAAALVDSVVRTYGFPRATVLGNVSGLLGPLAAHGTLQERVGLGSSATVQRAHEKRAPQVVLSLDSACEPWLAQVLPAGSDVLVVPLRAAEQALGALVLQIPRALRAV